MFGLFFDRQNTKQKNNNDKPKELSPRTFQKPQSPTIPTQNSTHSLRISSTSPTSHSSQTTFTQNSNYSPGPQYSPQYKKPAEDRRFITSKQSPKRLEDEHPVNPTPVRIDKPKQHFNFEFRPLDRDSFTANMGSITESTLEGSLLAQGIPASKAVNASKIPTLLRGPNDQMIFKVKNKDTGEVYDIRDLPHNREFDETKNSISLNKKPQAWQDWWSEKKKINQDLLSSAKFGDFETCVELLDKKRGELRADVNTKGENDWTPLHFACLGGNVRLVNLLIYNGANVDAETTLKFTPLIIACQKGYEEIAHILINSGSDINAHDIYNNTPLHYCAQYGYKKLVQLLLQRPSIYLNKKNNDNRTPYEMTMDRDIKQIFDIFLTEKNLLNTKFSQKVTIHSTKSENVKQMFDHYRPESTNSNISPAFSKQITPIKKVELEVDTKKIPSYGNNTTSANSDNTKLSSSSLNTSNSDSDLSGNVIGTDEEKVGPHSFLVHNLIGKGSFGEVYLVEKKNTKSFYAMKVLHKTKIMKHNLVKYALTERNVLSITNHPFIVKLTYAFQTSDKLFLILDYCPGGDLGEHLQKERRFTEDRAKIYLAEIVLALEDLHRRDIIFRDLKPDNIVLDVEGHAMLTDFGLSKEGVLDHSQGARSFCGSVAYLAPEMLKRVGHGKAVDWYLLGVVFYEMLVGVPPYYANNREKLFENIEKAPLKIPAHLSNEAKSLLKSLLQRNPIKRLGSGKGDADEVKSHKFFENINWTDVERRKLKPPVPEKKIRLNAKVALNIFESTSNSTTGDKDHISGWSFVATDNHTVPTGN
jgi:ankyrin repeat protein